MSKKYRSEENFSVLNKKTGKKICDCSEEIDAIMMVSFDPQNRTYTRNQFLMGQIIDVKAQKALPTSEIVIDTKKYQKHQEEWMIERIKELKESKLKEFVVE